MNLQKLYESKRTVYSMEVFPPKKTSSIDTIYNTLYGLRTLPVDFISVTYGAGGSTQQKEKTLEIASLIKSEYRIEPLVHLTCLNSTKEEVRQMLDRLNQLGLKNILVLRGDQSPTVEPKHDFEHASDLAVFIKAYDPSFQLAGACYPEGHYDAATLEEDIENLKYKLDAGVTSLVTQLFFDNEAYYRFRDKMEKAGIHVPVEAGIMPIVKKSQIERTVSMCGASIPPQLSRMFQRYGDDPQALFDAGIHYAITQMIDLAASGISGLHVYTMNNVEVARRITDGVWSVIESNNR